MRERRPQILSSMPDAEMTDVEMADAEMADAEMADAEMADTEMADAEMANIDAYTSGAGSFQPPPSTATQDQTREYSASQLGTNPWLSRYAAHRAKQRAWAAQAEEKRRKAEADEQEARERQLERIEQVEAATGTKTDEAGKAA